MSFFFSRLKNLHDADIIHRDLHSGNILSTGNNNFSIGDLGLSQPVDNVSSKTKVYGVVPYIAPEMFNGASFSKASDVYSMGMIMWELA